ncbi:MAG: HD domain-containing protein [Myxococcota bacterium]
MRADETRTKGLDGLRMAIEGDTELAGLLREVAPRLDEDPGHDLEHCLRVAMWTIRLADGTIDWRRAVAAALLHDIINPPKDSPQRALASERSADEARRVLPRFGFDAEAVEDIALAIRDHSFSRGATPERPLGKALQDADRLEALGALGVFRTISTGTRMGGRYFHSADPWAQRRPLDDHAHSVDHFFTKLLGLPDTMNTEPGRREAERRAEFMRQLLRQLGEELGQPPPF